MGNTVVLEEVLPEGVAVDVVVHDSTVDEETVAELQQALREADAGEFVSEEEVWAAIEARYGSE